MHAVNKLVTVPDGGEISRMAVDAMLVGTSGCVQKNRDLRVKKMKKDLRNNLNPITHQTRI